MAPRPPSYARYSPDTPSDESSEDELPNFTLLTEESILPEGSKRTRSQRVPLVFDEPLYSPPPRPRRSRKTRSTISRSREPEQEVGPEPGPGERGPKTQRVRPPKNARELSSAPRKFKRRRIVAESPSPDSEDESGGSDHDRSEDDEEEEDPVRPMPSRRSVKASATPTAGSVSGVAGTRSRGESSDLSSPPDSDSDHDESINRIEHDLKEESDEALGPVDEVMAVEPKPARLSAEQREGPANLTKVQTKMSTAKRRQKEKRKPSSVSSTIEVELPQTSLDQMTLASPDKASHSQVEVPDEMEGVLASVELPIPVATIPAAGADAVPEQAVSEFPALAPSRPTFEALIKQPTETSSRKQDNDPVDEVVENLIRERSQGMIEPQAEEVIKKAKPARSEALVKKYPILPSGQRSQKCAGKAGEKSKPKTVGTPKRTALVSEVKETQPIEPSKGATAEESSDVYTAFPVKKPVEVLIEVTAKKPKRKQVRKPKVVGATQVAPVAPVSQKPQSTQPIQSAQPAQPMQQVPLPAPAPPRRVKEMAGTRPASTIPITTNLPMPPARTHVRHRSMDIASLLNDDDAPSLIPKQSLHRPHPDYMAPHQPLLSFPAATESFMRSSPAATESFVRSSSAPHRASSLSFSPITSAHHDFAPSPLTPINHNPTQQQSPIEPLHPLNHEADRRNTQRASHTSQGKFHASASLLHSRLSFPIP